MIELVVFVTGAVVMALEILGTRVLNPSFGSGLHVWSALITVTLVALAAGYFLGGLVADRWPRRPVLFGLLAGVAGLLLLVVLVAPPLLRATEGLGIRLGALVGALIVFGWPLLGLGMVTPFAVRLRTRDVTRVGHVAGRLYALGTVGSVVGTLTTSFVLVPYVSHRTVLLLLAGVLASLAAVGLLLARRVKPAAVVVLVFTVGLALLSSWSPRATPIPGVLYDSDGILGRLTVLEKTYADGYTERLFLVDGGCQTHLPPDPDDGVDCEYIQLFGLLDFWRGRGRNCFLIGLAGGAIVRLLGPYGVAFDVADIDPRSLHVATTYFRSLEDVECTFYLEDGRRQLRQMDRRYDYVVIDMLTIDAVPFHLYSREAFEEARDRLKPDGILALNTSLTWDAHGLFLQPVHVPDTPGRVSPRALLPRPREPGVPYGKPGLLRVSRTPRR